ncbi:MAG: hypothetical protein P8107_07655 [Spirochaetia bacterium]
MLMKSNTRLQPNIPVRMGLPALLTAMLLQIEQLQYDVHSLLVIRNGYLVMEVY